MIKIFSKNKSLFKSIKEDFTALKKEWFVTLPEKTEKNIAKLDKAIFLIFSNNR